MITKKINKGNKMKKIVQLFGILFFIIAINFLFISIFATAQMPSNSVDIPLLDKKQELIPIPVQEEVKPVYSATNTDVKKLQYPPYDPQKLIDFCKKAGIAVPTTPPAERHYTQSTQQDLDEFCKKQGIARVVSTNLPVVEQSKEDINTVDYKRKISKLKSEIDDLRSEVDNLRRDRDRVNENASAISSNTSQPTQNKIIYIHDSTIPELTTTPATTNYSSYRTSEDTLASIAIIRECLSPKKTQPEPDSQPADNRNYYERNGFVQTGATEYVKPNAYGLGVGMNQFGAPVKTVPAY